MRQKADQASAFGQEPWAQQALAMLRRNRPDWAFLVVRYQWLALRGKQVLISATGPDELRQALPSVPPKPVPAELGSAASIPIERGMTGFGTALPTSDESLAHRPMRNVSLPPALPLGADAAGARGGDVGVGLSGTLTAVGPPLGVLAAERSGTGTWAVAAAGPVRVAWWPHGWLMWPWGRRRSRSRLEARAGEGERGAVRDRLLAGGGGPRHRWVEARRSDRCRRLTGGMPRRAGHPGARA